MRISEAFKFVKMPIAHALYTPHIKAFFVGLKTKNAAYKGYYWRLQRLM